MAIARFVSVVQRRGFGVDDSQGVIFPLIEPLFRIETHMSFEERLELFRLALQLPSGFVACEIGSYLGASTAFLAAAASMRGGHVHAVDTWRNDDMPDEPGIDTFDRFLNNTRLFQHVITIHRGLAADMRHRVPERRSLVRRRRPLVPRRSRRIWPTTGRSSNRVESWCCTISATRRSSAPCTKRFRPSMLESVGSVHTVQAFRVDGASAARRRTQGV